MTEYDNSQLYKLRRERDKLDKVIKDWEADIEARKAAQTDKQADFLGTKKSKPTSFNYVPAESLFRDSPGNKALLQKYSASIGPTRSYTLKFSHDELSFIKALLEIRKEIDPSAPVQSIIEQIKVQQRIQGY